MTEVPEKLTLHEISFQLKEVNDKLGSLEKKVDPIIEAYQSVLFGKKFLIGVASIVGAFAVIGGGVLWLFDYIRNHN